MSGSSSIGGGGGMQMFQRPQTSLDRDPQLSQAGTSLHYNRHKHLSLRQQRELLPIYRHKTAILYAVEKFRTVVLIGGKYRSLLTSIVY